MDRNNNLWKLRHGVRSEYSDATMRNNARASNRLQREQTYIDRGQKVVEASLNHTRRTFAPGAQQKVAGSTNRARIEAARRHMRNNTVPPLRYTHKPDHLQRKLEGERPLCISGKKHLPNADVSTRDVNLRLVRYTATNVPLPNIENTAKAKSSTADDENGKDATSEDKAEQEAKEESAMKRRQQSAEMMTRPSRENFFRAMSKPKNVSHVRSVRSRLHEEFSQSRETTMPNVKRRHTLESNSFDDLTDAKTKLHLMQLHDRAKNDSGGSHNAKA